MSKLLVTNVKATKKHSYYTFLQCTIKGLWSSSLFSCSHINFYIMFYSLDLSSLFVMLWRYERKPLANNTKLGEIPYFIKFTWSSLLKKNYIYWLGSKVKPSLSLPFRVWKSNLPKSLLFSCKDLAAFLRQ